MESRTTQTNARANQAADELRMAMEDASSVLRDIRDYWKDNPEMSRFMDSELSAFEDGKRKTNALVNDALRSIEDSKQQEQQKDDKYSRSQNIWK